MRSFIQIISVIMALIWAMPSEGRESLLRSKEGNSLRVGDEVLDRHWYQGRIADAKDTETVYLRIQYHPEMTYSRKVHELSRLVKCRQFCVGERVFDSAYNPARILIIAEDGRVRLDYEGWQKWNQTGKSHEDFLRRSIRCMPDKSFCRGARVEDSRGLNGKIISLYDDGVANIEFDSIPYSDFRPVTELKTSREP